MSRSVTSYLSSALAHVCVFAILAVTVVTVRCARGVRRAMRLRPRRRAFGECRVLVTGTFYNENWYRSHILPLSSAKSIRQIYVITDRPLFSVENVRYVCPPRLLAAIVSRNVARIIMVVYTGVRYRPDVFMGYHIMPNALICLAASALFGGQSVYQMTGGPIQIIGGGMGSENVLLSRLRRCSPRLERLLFGVVRLIDHVVVRGGHAAEFVKSNQLARHTLVLSGSVDTDRFHPNGKAKEFDLVLVARLIKEKQPELFLEIVSKAAQQYPGLRAAVVGDGPMAADLKSQARRLSMDETVEFLGKVDRVDHVLTASRVFMLTSATEGLSIAMVEAMATGLPALVPKIGELGELLTDGEGGLFIEPKDVAGVADRTVRLLRDGQRLARMSEAARRRAVTSNSVQAVAQKWDTHFRQTICSPVLS